MRTKTLLAPTLLTLASLLVAAPASATAILGDWFANLDTLSLRDGRTRVDLYSGGVYDADVFGGGQVRDWGDSGGVPRDAGEALWWALDPFGGRIVDTTRILSFLFDDTGNFMGIQPTPFRLAIGYPPDPVRPVSGIEPTPFRDPMGFLDFSNVFGVRLGSLENLSGLQMTSADGAVLETFAPFSIRNVPEPGLPLLFAFGLAGLLVARYLPRANRSSRLPSAAAA